MKVKLFYTYIIRCKNNTLYTGYTTDIKRRMIEHTQGINCKYTKNNGFDRLEIYFESMSRKTAMKLECYIKKMTRSKKLKIIENPNILIDEFFEVKSEQVRIGTINVDIINNEVKEFKKVINKV